jgi:fused signal recognition particle receptor
LEEEKQRGAWYAKLKQALSNSREAVAGPLNRIVGRGGLDDAAWEELEEVLIASDMGIDAAISITDAAKKETRRLGSSNPEAVKAIIKDQIAARLKAVQPDYEIMKPGESLTALVLVGINGTGKTTTAGKIAARTAGDGHKTVIAAADTFRAAAIEQITIWANKSGADIVKHQRGGDSAAVAFDAAKAATARGADFLIVDTAGRLHTKTPLMEELKKVKNAILKEAPGAIIRTLIVIDATTGQNGLVQAKTFQHDVGVDGVVLTKLDGTAKGGIAVAIAGELGVPVVLAGTGEKQEDLVVFDADAFAEGLTT